jgi:hypothetical protein
MTNVTRLPFTLRGRCKVVGIHEHIRTISGRKDSIGNAVLSQISLGWFIHTDLDDGGLSFGYGPEKPPLQTGDTLEISLVKVEP